MSYASPTEPREREEAHQHWRTEIRERIESLDRGEGLEFADEQSLRAFADEIKAEGRRDYVEDSNSP